MSDRGDSGVRVRGNGGGRVVAVLAAALTFLLLLASGSAGVLAWIWLVPPQRIIDPYPHVKDVLHREQIPLFNRPSFYKIQLTLFLPYHRGVSFGERNFTFEGQMEMIFRVEVANKRLLLHSKQLEIIQVSVLEDGAVPVHLAAVKRHEYEQLLDIETAGMLAQNATYTLVVKYRGKIDRKSNAGIFSAPYNQNGERRYMLATHLQPQEARRAFPCIDVPEAKAVFQTEVRHPKGTHAVSNAKEDDLGEREETDDWGVWTVTRFEPTPLMSTYLFALCVSDFPHTETTTEAGVRVRIYAEPSKAHDTGHAMQLIPQLLAFYDDYFRIKYPLAKLDLYAVPALKVAAMENWGLIICRQKFVVYNEHVNTLSERKDSIIILSHELAHQWFGNLVTMRWWNNLWLNEGFATMIGTKAADFVDQHTVLGEETMITSLAHTLRIDQQDKVAAVSIREGVAFEPEKQFNQIVYKKAACLLRMVERVVGASTFRDGLSHFLQRFAYRNADHKDLLDALTLTHDAAEGSLLSGQSFTLSDMIETWIYHKGFPVVQVERDPAEGSSCVRISQSYFRIFTPNAHLPPPGDAVWKTPLFLLDPHDGQPRVHWLVENNTVSVDMGDQLVLDRDVHTFMRIRYDDELYERITAQLLKNPKKLSIATRSRIIDDSCNFAEKGDISYRNVFRIFFFLRKERDFTPFIMANAHLDVYIARFSAAPQYALLKEFLMRILEPLFHQFINNPGGNTSVPEWNEDQFRELVFTKMCLSGHPPCIQYSRRLFDQLKEACKDKLLSDNSCNTIPSYMRSPVYGTSIMFGDQHDFDFLHEKWLGEIYQSERDRIWKAMAASTKKHLIHRIFRDVMLDHSGREDFRTHCAEHVKYHHPVNHFKSFLIENMDEVFTKYHHVDNYLNVILLCFSRSIEENDLDVFSMVEQRMNASLARPAKRASQYYERFHSIREWKRLYAREFFGNLTDVLGDKSLMIN